MSDNRDTTTETDTNTSMGRPDPDSSTVMVKSERPFAQAMEMYKLDFLEPAVLKAIAHLSKQEDKSRYARVKLGLFKDVIEIDIKTEMKTGMEIEEGVRTYTYPLHKLHYGPIDKSVTDSIVFDEGATPDFVRATKFCFRDSSIWLEVNAKNKLPGGDGQGYEGSACSPFRDTQISLRDKGYYLQDLSKYIYDQDNEKWYYKIDIRLYQSLDAVQPQNLWHGYGVIPGLGSIDRAQVNPKYPSYSYSIH